MGGKAQVRLPTPFKWNFNRLFSARNRYWRSELLFCTMRRFPFQSVGRTQALMVMPAVMLRLAALLTVTDCVRLASKERQDAPMRPGRTHVGLLTNVPVLLLPEESAAVLPARSSNLQLAARPLVT